MRDVLPEFKCPAMTWTGIGSRSCRGGIVSFKNDCPEIFISRREINKESVFKVLRIFNN